MYAYFSSIIFIVTAAILYDKRDHQDLKKKL